MWGEPQWFPPPTKGRARGAKVLLVRAYGGEWPECYESARMRLFFKVRCRSAGSYAKGPVFSCAPLRRRSGACARWGRMGTAEANRGSFRGSVLRSVLRVASFVIMLHFAREGCERPGLAELFFFFFVNVFFGNRNLDRTCEAPSNFPNAPSSV